MDLCLAPPILLNATTPPLKQVMILNGRTLIEMQEVEAYIQAAKSRKMETLHTVEHRLATLTNTTTNVEAYIQASRKQKLETLYNVERCSIAYANTIGVGTSCRHQEMRVPDSLDTSNVHLIGLMVI